MVTAAPITFSDARHSVSLIHVSGKSSSIGSFLEHCFSPEEQEVQTSGATPNDKDQFRYPLCNLFQNPMYLVGLFESFSNLYVTFNPIILCSVIS